MLLDVIEETMILKYQIELYADGLVDREGCELPIAERLSELRIRRQAWKEINWERQRFPLIPGSWNAYELVDGIFSKTLNSIGDNTARGIMFASLPSRYDTTGSLILYEDLGITFRDFAMDPTQDLIVYMQCSRVSDPTRYVYSPSGLNIPNVYSVLAPLFSHMSRFISEKSLKIKYIHGVSLQLSHAFLCTHPRI